MDKRPACVEQARASTQVPSSPFTATFGIAGRVGARTRLTHTGDTGRKSPRLLVLHDVPGPTGDPKAWCSCGIFARAEGSHQNKAKGTSSERGKHRVSPPECFLEVELGEELHTSGGALLYCSLGL